LTQKAAENAMSKVFPEPIRRLPQADIPLSGLKAYLSQSDDHQILFMEFDEDVEVPEHSHESQWGVVLEGKIDLVIEGVERTYTKGDRVFIPKGAKHSARIYAGYADISFFNEKDRYKRKQPTVTS
jgi:quercetin dioxygenase-like cupin family protein